MRTVILNWLCRQEHMVAQESVVSQSERREERRMNMYKSMRIGAMHNVRYNEEAVHTKNIPTWP